MTLPSPDTLPAGVRRERMLALIRQSDFVRVCDLGTRFGISEVTVRSDLDALAARQEIQRIHGGAMAVRASDERPFEETQAAFAAEKLAIATAAAAMVHDGETILLDVGTTAAS